MVGHSHIARCHAAQDGQRLEVRQWKKHENGSIATCLHTRSSPIQYRSQLSINQAQDIRIEDCPLFYTIRQVLYKTSTGTYIYDRGKFRMAYQEFSALALF